MSSIRSSRGNVVGIDIGGTKVEVALATGEGELLERIRFDTLADSGPEQALARIAAAVRRLSTLSTTRYGTPVVAHAAVCPGVVQLEQILLAPNLPGWENLALGRRLAADLGVRQVAVSNDVRAGALAEARFGALRAVDPGMYVSLGTGIAAALVIGGKVVSGAHQAGGEIAYSVPTWCEPDAIGDGRPLLEELVGGRALGERASAAQGRTVRTSELFTAIGDEIVHAGLDNLAIAIANLAVFVDPERIAVGGGMMSSGELILPALAERLKEIVPFPPEIVEAHFTRDASLYGAIALASESAASCS